ncbi:Flagellar hook-associated protein 3 [Methylophilaceae bacterium]|nr:Flagellar hook-associated protein 3 [Methylophilaceae bacterium]
MRISTNTIYQSGIARISELTASQAKLNQQIATGRRILTPSDDPVGSARALELKQATSVNNQYTSNRQVVSRYLGVEESTLASITDVMLSVKSGLVSAGNSTYSDTERSYLAAEVRSALDQLIGLANTKDGTGNYIFSGYQSQTPAYVKTATGALYQGDSNQRLLQVSASRQIPLGDTGESIFQANGNDIFQTLTDLAALLDTPVTDAASSAALSAGLVIAQAGVDAIMDSVLTTRAMVGTRLHELDALEEFGQELNLQYAQSLSEVEELDYAKAISDLSQQQVILQAAQQSFIKTAGLSLFDYF